MSEPIPFPESPSPQPASANGLGLAGFIVSLVGVVLTCGVLCPVGLVLSLFGLRKEPRGFAIAGVAIGAAGSLFAVFVGFAIVAGFLAVKKGIEEGGGPIGTTFVLLEASQTIEMEKADKGRLPDAAEGTAAIAELRDGWERALQYEPKDDGFVIRSAGPDGVFGNGDDLTQESR